MNDKFNKEGPLYSFTTENLGYINDLNIRNSKVLTIGGSYDQAIYTKLLGAKEVLNIDINQRAKYYAELKHIAVQYLTYNEYKNFFLLTSDAFDIDTYMWLSTHLTLDAKEFYNEMYQNYPDGGKLRESNIFNNKYDNPEDKIKNCIYLQHQDIYRITQKVMLEQSFNWQTTTIEKSLEEEHLWDLILLSNIADYAHYMFKEKYLEKFKEKIVLKALSRLHSHGQLMFAYIFDSKNILDSDKRNLLNDRDTRLELYSNIHGYQYSEIVVTSAIKEAQTDCACVLIKED